MAWTKVVKTQLDVNGTTPLAITNSPAAAQNDILCAFVASDNGAVVTGPSGWTKVSTVDSGAGNQKIEYWRKVAGAGEGTTYSWSTPGGSLTCITFFQLTGGDTATPEDATPTTVTNASTASLAATSITTVTAGAMLLGAWLESGQAASLTIDAAMTAEANQLATGHPNAMGVGSQTLGAAGATGTRTSSWTGACPAGAMLVAIRPSGSAAVVVPAPFLSKQRLGLGFARVLPPTIQAVDVTVALTGVGVTTNVGSLGVQHDQALTGVAETSAVGTLTPTLSVAITGVVATGSVGNLAPSTTVAITGVVVTGSVGNIVPGTSVLITGLSVAATAGSLAAALAVGLSGVTVTASVGQVTASGGDPVAGSARKSVLISFTDTYRIN